MTNVRLQDYITTFTSRITESSLDSTLDMRLPWCIRLMWHGAETLSYTHLIFQILIATLQMSHFMTSLDAFFMSLTFDTFTQLCSYSFCALS